MPAARKSDAPITITVPEVRFARTQIYIVGLTPFICNRMAEKAKRELLFPSGRKTSADRATSMKHDPVQEYRDSILHYPGPHAPAIIGCPATAFKGVLSTAALDVPGTHKTQIGRLVWINSYTVPLFGVPKLLMSVVRSADMNHTPDIRTRAILPEWACEIEVEFVIPLVNETSVVNLLHMGGRTVGVGDFRSEKGKGNFGQFRLCNEDDKDYLRIVAECGSLAQQRAIDNYECFDQDSRELLDWYESETKRRGKKADA